MPRLPAPPPLNTVIDRSTTNTTKALQVICAFPLSGQYGPGSRFLYVEIHYFAEMEESIKAIRNILEYAKKYMIIGNWD